MTDTFYTHWRDRHDKGRAPDKANRGVRIVSTYERLRRMGDDMHIGYVGWERDPQGKPGHDYKRVWKTKAILKPDNTLYILKTFEGQPCWNKVFGFMFGINMYTIKQVDVIGVDVMFGSNKFSVKAGSEVVIDLTTRVPLKFLPPLQRVTNEDARLEFNRFLKKVRTEFLVRAKLGAFDNIPEQHGVLNKNETTALALLRNCNPENADSYLPLAACVKADMTHWRRRNKQDWGQAFNRWVNNHRLNMHSQAGVHTFE